MQMYELSDCEIEEVCGAVLPALAIPAIIGGVGAGIAYYGGTSNPSLPGAIVAIGSGAAGGAAGGFIGTMIGTFGGLAGGQINYWV